MIKIENNSLSGCLFRKAECEEPELLIQFSIRERTGLILRPYEEPTCLSLKEIDRIINVLERGKRALVDYASTAKRIDSIAVAERAERLASNPIPAREKPKNYVYLMVDKRNGLVKIGRSTDPARREKTLQSEVPEISMIGAWEAPSKTESQLHRKYASQRVRGEWFDLSDASINAIKAHLHNVEKNYE